MAWHLRRTGGFTLLEVIVIIAIMSFLAAMVVPFVGHLDNKQRTKATRERLESIRTAIIGPQNTYDERGLRVVRGYAGEMDALPKLYELTWDDGNNRWEKPAGIDPDDYEEVYNGGDRNNFDYIGQPLGLWEKFDQDPTSGVTWDTWKGPYLNYPKAVFDNRDKDVNPLRKTEGILADAWGRALFFIKEQDDNGIYLLIISAGPDGKVELPPDTETWQGLTPPAPLKRDSYKNLADLENKNKDNIVLEITPEEWYKPNLGIHEEQTRQILEKIRTALLGPPDAFDPSGRRIVGGYIGDMGQWPTLWEWDDVADPNNPEWVTSSTDEGQPRGLWVWMGSGEGYSDHDPPATDPTGFRWRGPYLPKPWGTGEEEVLRDAWGEPLVFKYDDPDPQLATTLTITSAGRNKTPDGVPPAGDDIELKFEDSQWKVGGMVVNGTVTNNTPVPDDVEVILYSQPPDIESSDDGTVVSGGAFEFELTGEVYAGARTLKVLVGGTERYSAQVFIGTGKTQSPVKEKLVFTVD